MRILLIDGNNVYARAWFAITGQGKKLAPEQAIKMTIERLKSMLVVLRREHFVDKTIVCWDGGKDEERMALYQDYKVREAKPHEYYLGITAAQHAIEGSGYYVQVTRPNTECDDILATLARYCSCLDDTVIIATDDKDMLQLLNKNIIIAHSKKGNIDTGRFVATYGFQPALFVDYLAIVGDTTDNIPGIQGIGEKGATELLVQFGTIETIYANIRHVPKKYFKKLQDGFQNAMLSKKLATLKMILELDIDWTRIHYPNVNEFSEPAVL